MLFVNHAEQFKYLAKRMWNVNVNCGYLNLDSEGKYELFFISCFCVCISLHLVLVIAADFIYAV